MSRRWLSHSTCLRWAQYFHYQWSLLVRASSYHCLRWHPADSFATITTLHFLLCYIQRRDSDRDRFSLLLDCTICPSNTLNIFSLTTYLRTQTKLILIPYTRVETVTFKRLAIRLIVATHLIKPFSLTLFAFSSPSRQFCEVVAPDFNCSMFNFAFLFLRCSKLHGSDSNCYGVAPLFQLSWTTGSRRGQHITCLFKRDYPYARTFAR